MVNRNTINPLTSFRAGCQHKEQIQHTSVNLLDMTHIINLLFSSAKLSPTPFQLEFF